MLLLPPETLGFTRILRHSTWPRWPRAHINESNNAWHKVGTDQKDICLIIGYRKADDTVKELIEGS